MSSHADGTTTDAYVVLAECHMDGGGEGLTEFGAIENLGTANSLTARLTARDLQGNNEAFKEFGLGPRGRLLVNTLSLDLGVKYAPPYSFLRIEVRSTSAGAHTTYSLRLAQLTDEHDLQIVADTVTALQGAVTALSAKLDRLIAHHNLLTERANHAHLFACVVNRQGELKRPEWGEPFDAHHLADLPPFEG